MPIQQRFNKCERLECYCFNVKIEEPYSRRHLGTRPGADLSPAPSVGTEARRATGSVLYPMAGAVLGSCIGAPVGILAGVKIGGLAALSGLILGDK